MERTTTSTSFCPADRPLDQLEPAVWARIDQMRRETPRADGAWAWRTALAAVCLRAAGERKIKALANASAGARVPTPQISVRQFPAGGLPKHRTNFYRQGAASLGRNGPGAASIP